MITNAKITDINTALTQLGTALGCSTTGTQVRPTDIAQVESTSVDVLAVFTRATELTNVEKLVTIPTALANFANNAARNYKVKNFAIETVANPQGSGFAYYFKSTFAE